MTADQDPSSGVDDLRAQLRALGYLDARVDRFVLGRAASGRKAWSLALAASGRIGALAGVLLGPAAAVGLSTRLPGLVTSLADALVLAAYLAVLFAVGTGTLAFAAILIAGAVVRRSAAQDGFAARARRAAALAGLAVGAACLVYLTLWWRATTVPMGPLAGTGAQVLVLAVAVVISGLIGHGVTLTVLATLVRFGLARSLAPGSPLSSTRALVSIGVLALAGALTLLVTTAPRAATTDNVPPLTVVPTGLQVVVIAIDGVDVPTLTRLVDTGATPALAALTAHARARLETDPDRDPARVWTTIATGQPPERHGIQTLEARQLAGVGGRLRAETPGQGLIAAATDALRLTRPTIASGDERVLPAFWEVAATAGLRTAVVHWWATWPAPEGPGTVLSDRAVLRLETGGPLAGEIAPAALYDTLRQEVDARHARIAAAIGQGWPAGLSPEVTDVLTRSAELDATVLDLAGDPALGALDLLTLYLPGLDIAQYALLQGGDGSPLAASAAADRVRGIEAYYAFLDASLGRWLASRQQGQRQVILITQPGRVHQASSGLVAVSGTDAATVELDGVPPTGVAPTILTALGVPVATDLASPALRALLSGDFQARFPERTVTTYGERRPSAQARTGRPLDREMIERMRSLGYVR